MNGWQEVPLGSLLTRIKDDVLIEDFEKYQRLTIRTNNKGIEIRDELEGHLIGTKNQYVVHGGQFLLSKIDAMNGAFGIVPENVENGIITSNFWAYDVDEEKLFSKYFNYLTHTRSFQEFCIQASSGTTHRKYLREDLFLGMEIPLPPLTEQRRIVAHIESLAARVNEAQSLREEAEIAANKLLDSALIHLFENDNVPKKSLREVSRFQRGRFSWRPRNDPRFYDGKYPFIQIGDIPRDRKLITSHTQTLNEDGLKISLMFPAGTIVLSIAATIGAVGILGFDSCMPDSLVGLNVKPEIAISDYLYYFLKYSQSHFEHIAPQSAQKNINIGILESVSLPIPPLAEQRRIVAYLDGLQAKVAALRELQSQTQEELDALLPSVLDRAFKGEL